MSTPLRWASRLRGAGTCRRAGGAGVAEAPSAGCGRVCSGRVVTGTCGQPERGPVSPGEQPDVAPCPEARGHLLSPQHAAGPSSSAGSGGHAKHAAFCSLKTFSKTRRCVEKERKAIVVEAPEPPEDGCPSRSLPAARSQDPRSAAPEAGPLPACTAPASPALRPCARGQVSGRALTLGRAPDLPRGGRCVLATCCWDSPVKAHRTPFHGAQGEPALSRVLTSPWRGDRCHGGL